MGFVGLGLLVGAADASVLHSGARAWYRSLVQPPGTAPDWALGPTWLVLSVLIGLAAWLVWRRVAAGPALQLWGWQIAANALWLPVFFGLHRIAFAFVVSLVLLALAAATMRAFARLSRVAGWLMLPYLLWTLYGACINAGFWWLNGA